MSEAKRMIDTAEAAELLGMSRQTLYNWRNLGIGPQFYVLERGAVRYRVSELEEYLENCANRRPRARRGRKQTKPATATTCQSQ